MWDDVELLALAGCGFSGEAGALVPKQQAGSCTRGRGTRVRGNAGKRAVLLDETTQASGESCRARSHTHLLLEERKRKKEREKKVARG